MERENETYPACSAINAYGVVGDHHSIMLIAPNGAVDWACLPDFDSPPIFCRLLDARHGGYFQIAPTHGAQHGSQCYLHRSNILQTRFVDEEGTLELTDFMPLETLKPAPRAAVDASSGQSLHSCLVRMVECIHGDMSVSMRFKVTPHGATVPTNIVFCPDDMGVFVSGGLQHVALALSGGHRVPSFSMGVIQDVEEWHPTVHARFQMHAGESMIFALGVENSVQTAHQLFWDELLQRDFNAELIQTLQCWLDKVA